jgi:hypothetical protein
MPWQKPEKLFSGGKGGRGPPISATNIVNQREKGASIFSPPNIWSRSKTHHHLVIICGILRGFGDNHKRVTKNV